MARINLRMPDHLKSRIDRAAAGQGLSVNAWLVRAAAATLEHAEPTERPGRRVPQGAQRFTAGHADRPLAVPGGGGHHIDQYPRKDFHATFDTPRPI